MFIANSDMPTGAHCVQNCLETFHKSSLTEPQFLADCFRFLWRNSQHKISYLCCSVFCCCSVNAFRCAGVSTGQQKAFKFFQARLSSFPFSSPRVNLTVSYFVFQHSHQVLDFLIFIIYLFIYFFENPHLVDRTDIFHTLLKFCAV